VADGGVPLQLTLHCPVQLDWQSAMHVAEAPAAEHCVVQLVMHDALQFAEQLKDPGSAVQSAMHDPVQPPVQLASMPPEQDPETLAAQLIGEQSAVHPPDV
jgi:hypothetical protein